MSPKAEPGKESCTTCDTRKLDREKKTIETTRGSKKRRG